jgi:plasmid stabilization system protein ParE
MAPVLVEFHPQAALEARLAHQWYAERQCSIAEAFRIEVDLAVERIAENPLAHPTYTHGTRRILLRRFPFAVVYRSGETGVLVVAVAHTKRRPGYWIDRR